MQRRTSLCFAHDRPHRTGAGLRAAANVAPSISITAPANNAAFTAPATVHVTVSAADSDGTVTQVQYYDGVPPGAHLLGTLTTAPYSTDLLAQVAGVYTVVAVATDNSGAQTSSSILSFTVNASAGAAQVFYIHTDQLDTPRLITDSNNSAVWRWDNFDAFGDNPPNDDPSATGLHFIYNPRFAGQYFDKETRLNYNYFRDYDTGTGRYVESDPIGLRGGINTYSYANSNPLWYTDFLGLDYVYSQSTGQLTHVDSNGVSTAVSDGYAGHGQGVNNPDYQNVDSTGPLPQGTYDIGDPYNSGKTGPYTLPLTQTSGDDFGRSAFKIHGDNGKGDESASEGCVIQSQKTRRAIHKSGDKVLRVVP